MEELTKNKIDFLIALISEFANAYQLTTADAYAYIRKYGGVEFFEKHYDVLHTESFYWMTKDMAEYCRNHGGYLL